MIEFALNFQNTCFDASSCRTTSVYQISKEYAQTKKKMMCGIYRFRMRKGKKNNERAFLANPVNRTVVLLMLSA